LTDVSVMTAGLVHAGTDPCRREIITMLERTRNAFIHHTMHVPRTIFAAAINSFGARR
jgi:hypothetical protein